MVLPVYAYGHPILRRVAEDISKEFPEKDSLIANMFETMAVANGVGLAAPQVGKALRIFLVDARVYGDEFEDLKDFKRVFINAHIEERWGEEILESEGCLSIPNIHEDVYRYDHIRMRWVDEEFQPHEQEFSGMAARIIQHEYDHLDGILFTDKLSQLRKRLLKGKLKDISTGKAKVDYRMIYPTK